MLNDTGKQNLFDQMHELWIQPEINKRFAESGIPEGFKIWEALIKLPSDKPAIVEFNDEIQWEMGFKVAPDIAIEAGQLVYLHEVERVEHAMPPRVDGKRVAFVYLYWAGFSYNVIFDFAPNHNDFDAEADEFSLGTTIAQHKQAKIIELVIRLSRKSSTQLRRIGLWTPTCLIPYPLSRIISEIENNKLEEARRILTQFCTPAFLEELIETWLPIPVFNERMDVFRQSISAHREGKFRLSIYALVPQIEGVITDWLYPILQPKESMRQWSTKKRVDQFAAEMTKIPKLEFSYREALYSVIEFLKDGQPLQRFENWLDVIDPAFPARHPIAHGKNDDQLFTEENSIKLVLLLDTICQFMMFYEVRVLGKNLQSP